MDARCACTLLAYAVLEGRQLAWTNWEVYVVTLRPEGSRPRKCVCVHCGAVHVITGAVNTPADGRGSVGSCGGAARCSIGFAASPEPPAVAGFCGSGFDARPLLLLPLLLLLLGGAPGRASGSCCGWPGAAGDPGRCKLGGACGCPGRASDGGGAKPPLVPGRAAGGCMPGMGLSSGRGGGCIGLLGGGAPLLPLLLGAALGAGGWPEVLGALPAGAGRAGSCGGPAGAGGGGRARGFS